MATEKPATLKQWQKMFKEIYGKTNSGLRASDIWLHLMEEAGEVAKAMRKEDFLHLQQDLPDIFAWLCSFANRTGIDLEDALWQKYPSVCPYCLQDKYCVCIAESHDTYDDVRLVGYRKQNHKPVEFAEWEKMFRDILIPDRNKFRFKKACHIPPEFYSKFF